MAKKLLLSILVGIAVFMVSYGVMMAAQKYTGSSAESSGAEEGSTSEAQSREEDDLGSLGEEIETKPEKEEEFPILDKDKEKYEELLAVQEKEVTPLTPVNVSIPSLEIEADIIQVGIEEDGAMEVPENVNEVGWFEPGTKPGGVGNSVLAGHVDSYEGPAIFFELRNLTEGDEIIVTGEEGEPLTFVVTSMESYPADGAPLQEIFGPSDSRNLNLITCTGPFDRESGQYPDRLVVYTELVEEEPEELEYEPTVPTNVALTGNQFSWYAVRDQEVVGYRIYKELEDGTKEKIESVSYYERKSLIVEDPEAVYSVTAVSIDGKESEHGYLTEE
ncbi:class F sortase [Jeotgalibacillus sp. ET6]|uniref:class F sortase n=1 Tax=Jeotgalibacillus sp. ET6 TaxID=3037260 RepID=UPI00241836BA|nr:class F sortase [Jeotgalibacillus sp. ET6]MDG5471724.1 class F sortase [Jeotgalibacillus sp. ET6]